MREIIWEKAMENKLGVETIAYGVMQEIIGFNGILKGDKVLYEEKEYTVVMVSRLGDFGLSETGKLPYTVRVSALEVVKI